MIAGTMEADDTSVIPGTPEVLFEEQYFTGNGRHYDVAPDGRFLMVSSPLDSPDSTYVT